MKKFGWLKTIFIFAMLSGMMEFYVRGGEDNAMTATLRRNWQELQKRRLRLLPLPKKYISSSTPLASR